jgi:hypothetical protein
MKPGSKPGSSRILDSGGEFRMLSNREPLAISHYTLAINEQVNGPVLLSVNG